MIDKSKQRLSQVYTSNALIWTIIGVGVLLRLIRFLDNPSLYFDEAVYAVDLIKRSFAGLNVPAPDFSSVTPYGFLVLEKLAVWSFGSTEYTLRLFPFLFSILSLFLFLKVGKHYIKPKALPVALALFAILDHLVYYAALLKSYSVDLALTLLLLLIATHIQYKKTNAIQFVLFAIVGATAIWLSNPILFVLAGLGTSLMLFSLKKKEWPKLGRLFIVCLIWAISYAVLYFIYTRNIMAGLGLDIDHLLKLEKAYMPLPPKSFADFKWFIESFFATFDFQDPLDPTGGVALTGIAAFAFIVGCISMYSEHKERFLVLISPVLVTLAASALHMYPFKGRLILFLVPLLLLVVAEGALFVQERISTRSTIAGMVFVGLLFVYPLPQSIKHAIKPFARSQMRPVLTYIQNNWQDGDHIYVHYYAQYEFEFYSKHYKIPYGFDENEYTAGIAPRGWYRFWRKDEISKYYNGSAVTLQTNEAVLKEYVGDINKLRGNGRVWILFSDNIPRAGILEEDFFLSHLDSIGNRIDLFGDSGVTVAYLYDLSDQDGLEK